MLIEVLAVPNVLKHCIISERTFLGVYSVYFHYFVSAQVNLVAKHISVTAGMEKLLDSFDTLLDTCDDFHLLLDGVVRNNSLITQLEGSLPKTVSFHA